jgi:ribosome-associated translation inhibitor RaiA
MQVQVRTDNHIAGDQRLETYVQSVVEGTLERFARQITRVEVHLGDQNGPKSGQDDMRCMMEARLAGRQPVAVTEQAASLDEAIDGAANKLARMLESTLGQLRDQARQPKA